MTPQIILIAALGATVAVGAAGWYGRHVGDGEGYDRCKGEVAALQVKAVADARKDEQEKQKGVNDAIKKQVEGLEAVHAGLARDLERLRNRPARPAAGMPQNSDVQCKGATGAELSREDAEFLGREAARADILRTALQACYLAHDAISAEKEKLTK